jgi:hypothetical protein
VESNLNGEALLIMNFLLASIVKKKKKKERKKENLYFISEGRATHPQGGHSFLCCKCQLNPAHS